MTLQVCYPPGTDPGFQVRGAHLKKLRRVKGGAKMFGVFRVKNHDFKPKIIFFPIAQGKFLGYFVWKITILRQKIIFFPILGGAPHGSVPAHYSSSWGYTYYNLTTPLIGSPLSSIQCWQIKTDKLLLAKHKYVIHKEYNNGIKSHYCFLKPSTHTNNNKEHWNKIRNKKYHTVWAVP